MSGKIKKYLKYINLKKIRFSKKYKSVIVVMAFVAILGLLMVLKQNTKPSSFYQQAQVGSLPVEQKSQVRKKVAKETEKLETIMGQIEEKIKHDFQNQ